MSNDLYINKWLFCPYLKNNDLDYLIHPEDLDKLDSLGIVKGLGLDGEYLKVESKGGIVRVKIECVKRVFPSPDFIWGEEVDILSNLDSKAIIEDLFWHHNKEEFLYYLKVDGKKKSKQYSKNDLNAHSH